ncbi:MAG: hypothetical protein EOO11_14635 [Chitinophagaceae bacterium]|nr:MAG: hypothetical protein EOO11_14635 [Chitinophagaceae bacterium]
MDFAKPADTLADALDALPLPEGTSFREAAVWSGIDRSLRARRRRVLWPRLAAAVLLLLAGSFLLLQQEAPRSTAPAVVTAPQRISTRPALAATAASPAPVRPAAATAARRPATRVAAPGKPAADTTTLVAAVLLPPDTATVIAATTASTPAPGAAAPARRFRIAHINDPGTPVLPEMAAATIPDEERDPQSPLRLRRGASGPHTEAEGPHERRPRRFPFQRSPQ